MTDRYLLAAFVSQGEQAAMTACPTIFVQRACLIQALRDFFRGRDFLELDTPLLLPCRIPEAHIDTFSVDGLFIQASPELTMKRVLAMGPPRIFQICKCFRRGEQGTRHLPEFTMLEWYRADADYQILMDDCQGLFTFLAGRLAASGAFAALPPYLNPDKAESPWQRLSVTEAFRHFGALSVDEAIERGLFEEILLRDIEPNLGKKAPVFLADYPAQLAALARRKENDPGLAERFELYVAGLELANGFSELCDPVEQRQRFALEGAALCAQNLNPGPMPEAFLAELAAIGKAAGIALGVDRLLMLASNTNDIRDLQPFSPWRP